MKRLYFFLTLTISIINILDAMDSKQLPKEQSETHERSFSADQFDALLSLLREQEDKEFVHSVTKAGPETEDPQAQQSTIKRGTRPFNFDDSNIEEAASSGAPYAETTMDFANYRGEPTIDFALLRLQNDSKCIDPEESQYGDLDKSSFQEATINECRSPLRRIPYSPDDVIFTHSSTSCEISSDFLPLHDAVDSENSELVQQLIESGDVNLNAANKLGETALHYAAHHGFTQIVADLLTAGAEIDAKTIFGETALHYASLQGNTETIKLLLAKKADRDAQATNGWTPLHYASWHGHLEAAAILVVGKANTALTCAGNNTPLHFAVWRNHVKVASLLIFNGAPLTTVNSSGATALHHAAYKGNLTLVELLYSQDTNLTRVTLTGNSPLHCAAWRGHLAVVQFLHLRKVPVDARNANNMTALECAMDAFKKKLRATLDTTNSAYGKKKDTHLTHEKQAEYQEVIAFLSKL